MRRVNGLIPYISDPVSTRPIVMLASLIAGEGSKHDPGIEVLPLATLRSPLRGDISFLGRSRVDNLLKVHT